MLTMKKEELMTFVKALASCDAKDRAAVLTALTKMDYKEIQKMGGEELEKTISKRIFK